MIDKKFLTEKDLEEELLELRDRLCGIIDEYVMRERKEERGMIQGAIALGLGLITTCGTTCALVMNEHPFVAVATLFGGSASSVYVSYRLATKYLNGIDQRREIK